VILNTLQWFKNNEQFFDIIVLLEPTSPLRKKADIDNALRLFLKNSSHYDSLVSVGEVHMENPYILKKIDNNLITPLIDSKEKEYFQRQQLPIAYFPYGVIYVSKYSSLINYQSFYEGRTMPYYIERWQNYEIDDLFDFLCVEAMLKSQINEVKI
jgi:CMP-N-acetylneuraminic acid synthetase